MMWELLFIFIIVLVGGIIQGASGFGFGLVAMGLLPLIFTIKDSTLLVISLLVVASLTILIKNMKYIELKSLYIIVASSVFGRVFSFLVLSTYGDLNILKQYLGLFLIGMVIYLLFSKRKSSTEGKINPLLPISLGILSGFIGGLFAVGGPFLVFYFLMVYEDKRKYNANLQLTIILTSVITLALHGLNGDFSSMFYIYFLMGTAGVCIGTFIGLKWFDRLPNHLIKRFAMIIVALAGINLILFN